MGMTVWVDSWQMQCCGEPFRIGTQVAWPLGPVGRGWLAELLGPDARQTVDAAQERHGAVPDDTVPTRGTVTRITAVHGRFAAKASPDSAVLTDLDSADGRTADRGDLRFVGYLVRLRL